MKKRIELSMVSVGKGATGKMPSYLKKFVSEEKVRENTVETSAAEEMLFGLVGKNGDSRRTNKKSI